MPEYVARLSRMQIVSWFLSIDRRSQANSAPRNKKLTGAYAAAGLIEAYIADRRRSSAACRGDGASRRLCC
jgi:hypothetical protein